MNLVMHGEYGVNVQFETWGFSRYAPERRGKQSLYSESP